jgi:hypothetical protein
MIPDAPMLAIKHLGFALLEYYSTGSHRCIQMWDRLWSKWSKWGKWSLRSCCV